MKTKIKNLKRLIRGDKNKGQQVVVEDPYHQINRAAFEHNFKTLIGHFKAPTAPLHQP